MIVWSYGGGTQSAAIAVLILEGKLPMPDIICMADTAREVQETWDYLKRVVRPAGIDVKIIPHSYATVDLHGGRDDLLIPAFTRYRMDHNENDLLKPTHRSSIEVGKLPTFCSNEWKQRPVRRWLREQGVKDCDLWLGISTDEIERMKISDVKWQRNVYPLIEIIPTSRHQCVSLVERHGWPTPPKSRCFMCPNMSPSHWRTLRDKAPEDFAKAVELERELQTLDADIYLHKLGIPLTDAVAQSDLQSDMFDGCDSGFCWT